MTEEEKNILKRKNTPLTWDEWLGFFLVPVNMSHRSLFPTDDFNDTEVERFKKFNFDKKLKQSYQARILGAIFYFILIVLFTKYLY
ncbi:hypothetical protein [uncultured Tenacibaculum sp.]|uniref:hypothetical protein n=1 Tax=uncultured Tenacibaculum sp. TaxID=174713 RepID=UPI00261328A3|nr:hypothetical protein [uncultured Tenacibaculum sp.]